MNLTNILNSISQADPEFFERVSPRRKIIANWMPKVALSTLPMALGGLFNKAYGKGTDIIIDTLNFALTLEYLESSFYALALTKPNLIPTGQPQSDIQLIATNEAAHRDFVIATIHQLGGQPIPMPTFDYTGGNGSNAGPFADVFTNYSTFLGVAEAFEETGIRAYKGSAPNLMSNHAVLQAALQIHSVEGRHMAKLRKMRKESGFTTEKPWVTLAQSGQPPAGQAPYMGEDVVTQAGVSLVGTTASSVTLSAAAVSEAFDEPLTMAQVLAIADPFIV